jgi:capsular polysaccharide biosynthesis protein
VKEQHVPSKASALDPIADRIRPGVLTSVRRHVRLIAAAFLVGALLGVVGSVLIPTSYEAQSSLYLSAAADFDPTGAAVPDPVRYTADQVSIIITDVVLKNAGQRLKPQEPAAVVRKAVTVVGAVDTSTIVITAEGPTADQAKATADAVAQAYVQVTADRVATASANAQDAIEDGFLEQQIRLRAATYGDGVAAVQLAELPPAPSSPLLKQNALIGAIVGLLLGTAFAIASDQRRARRASIADLDLLIGAPLLGRYQGPANRSPTAMVDPDPPNSQLAGVADVLSAIDLSFEDEQQYSVLFLSWQRALTTTSLVAATGIAAARAGRRVVLVDGGLKDLGISVLSDSDPGLGLEGLASADSPLHASLRRWEVAGVTLDVVPLDGWSPSAAGAAARPQILRTAIARLQEISTLVLVDGPPLTERSLGLALGRGVDGVILVIDEATSINDAHEMGRRIALSGIEVLGYVLAGTSPQSGINRFTLTPKRLGEGSVSLGVSAGARRA